MAGTAVPVCRGPTDCSVLVLSRQGLLRGVDRVNPSETQHCASGGLLSQGRTTSRSCPSTAVRWWHRTVCAVAVWLGVGSLAFVSAETPEGTTAPDAAAVEFFEKRIRPVLVERCFECHSSGEPKGALRLDSRDAAMRGGESGPALSLIPGTTSLLLEALEYDPAGYQMPPDGKLPDDVIADFKTWIENGAVWPAETSPTSTSDLEHTGAAGTRSVLDRRDHWCWQPVRAVAPSIEYDAALLQQPVDGFIAARRHAAGLSPAAVAAPGVWLRRVTYELTGLPPTPAELDEFLTSDDPLIQERVVDRLLASPRYGERWGRHWLDLMRFAETSGHEFDFEIPFAWRYRDYVIRALNDDLPYADFITEQIAGDVLPQPRIDPATGTNQSLIATGQWWLGQGKHSPVDLKAEECDTIDNQIDVLGKALLGLTISCARCHDHKFDAITQADYYALAGLMQSSRQTLVDATSPTVMNELVEALETSAANALPEYRTHALAQGGRVVSLLPELLGVVEADELPESFVSRWRSGLQTAAENDPAHPLHLWVQWSSTPEHLTQRARQFAERQTANPEANVAQSSGRSDLGAAGVQSPQASAAGSWFTEGWAFGRPQTAAPQWLLGDVPWQPVRGIVPSSVWAHSGRISPGLTGTLRSPTFTITQKFIEYRAHRRLSGAVPPRPNKQGQINLVIDGFQFIRYPLYGHLSWNVPEQPTPARFVQDVSRFIGSRAYLEIEDFDAGELIVERIDFHDGESVPVLPNAAVTAAFREQPIRTPADVVAVWQSAFTTALAQLEKSASSARVDTHPATSSTPSPQPSDSTPLEVSEDQIRLVNWLLEQEFPSGASVTASPALQAAITQRLAIQARWPAPQLATAMAEGTAEDHPLLIRGQPHRPGSAVRRRFLEVLDGQQPLGPEAGLPGSGRRELAARLTDPTHPLTSRVLVNRVWMHLFGRGLVATPDDFGAMGQPPSHPELLDWLADDFQRHGGSLKHLQRRLVTSHTFSLASQPANPAMLEQDPINRWWHMMPVQRLEAEPIRDALLLLSDRLDDRMYGPSVMPYLTPFMEGRGRPGQSGPLDGDGRRSVYLSVRRNFLSPMFLAFDFPTPMTTVGKRSSSNVPAQALTLLNNPFVQQQAAGWAAQVLLSRSTADELLRRFYRGAFGRDPTAEELTLALDYLGEDSSAAGIASPSSVPLAWQELAHVLINVKDFFYVE
jgi:hypothetical protein